jgi:hypothetical protein
MSRRSVRARVAFAGACLLLAATLLPACAAPAPVVQGKVLAVDARTLRVEDETRPGTAIDLDISTAEIGNRPSVGDIVRVVYRNNGRPPRALAVMNLTQQQRTEKRGR